MCCFKVKSSAGSTRSTNSNPLEFVYPALFALFRMLYAFSRDGAVPGSRWWKQVHPGFQAPVNAVWFVVVMCLILGLPAVGSYVAFAAITSVGVIGLYLSYGECV